MANMTYTEAGYQHSSESNLVARAKMTVLTWLERSLQSSPALRAARLPAQDIGLERSRSLSRDHQAVLAWLISGHGCLVSLADPGA